MPRPRVDLTGRRFGRLTVVRSDGQRKPKGNYYWLCRCECGAEKAVKNSHLMDGTTVSCGCFSREQCGHRFRGKTSHNRKHGLSGTPTYVSWKCMRERCSNQGHPDYWRYGGMGVAVCPEWDSFEQFHSDMGDRPPGMTINRKDNSLGYCKSNCEWATQEEQHINRSITVYLSHGGETKPMKEWADRAGVSLKTYSSRRRLGWSDSEIVTTPVQHRGGAVRD